MIRHYLRFYDPTDTEPKPWKRAWQFMRQKAAGIPELKALFHDDIFIDDGSGGWDETEVDHVKLAMNAAKLPPKEPVLLNVEKPANIVHDDSANLNPEAVKRRMEIADTVRNHAPSGVQLGFFEQLPPCVPAFIWKDAVRPRWRRLCQDLIPLARKVDCCCIECYVRSDWALGKALWYMRETIKAVHEVYHLPAYVMFYTVWEDKIKEARAPENNSLEKQMPFRIPGDYFGELLKQAEALADGTIVFGASKVPWYDDDADWWKIFRGLMDSGCH
ncbi:hypothetical protein LCGC14_0325850 [marine sediment metagenome]|uniref:Uncharacterized protein n=1 Tax=marine sediment metagenome TaxID=412755 RepID=A0A0F9TND9_9ZZZZ